MNTEPHDEPAPGATETAQDKLVKRTDAAYKLWLLGGARRTYHMTLFNLPKEPAPQIHNEEDKSSES